MKWSTGQSGLIRTLRQVIKSTVAWMHGSDNKLHKPTFTWKNCFTFPKTTKRQLPSILQIPENSCKLHCAKLSKRNFHFSKNPNHKTKQQIVCFVYVFSCAKLSKDAACSFQSRIVTKHLDSLVWCLKHKADRKWMSQSTRLEKLYRLNCHLTNVVKYMSLVITFFLWSMPPSTFWRYSSRAAISTSKNT